MDYEIALALRHTEIWAGFACTIGHKLLLEVSSIGRRRVTNIKSGKVLKLDFGTLSNGYRYFGSFGTAYRAIAQAFIPTEKLTSNNIKISCSINHKDGNKLNNCVSNLEWCTHSDNMRHACATGLNKGSTDLHVHTYKHTDGRTLVGSYAHLKANAKELFGFSEGSVTLLKLGRYTSIRGWSYAGYS